MRGRPRIVNNPRPHVPNSHVSASLFEDGSVRVHGPRPVGVGNVGEGGPSRGGYGTVRVFGPSGVADPFKRKRKKR
jgi:hypothetical protein